MKVLLTGGSGFLGRHCIDVLLKHGHNKGRQILDSWSIYSGKLSYTIVEDIALPGAFDNSVQASPPFDAVLHTARPFHYNTTDPKKDMIDPAVISTTGILKSIVQHAPSIKRVVFTSSFAAILNLVSPPALYTSKMWNPITMEQALSGGQATYVGSKKFAEKAAWDFVEKENPSFTLSTINPVLVLGTSSWEKFKGDIKPGDFQWVDVRDVALAHVRAVEAYEAAGQRFIAAAGPYSNVQLAQIAKDKFPELRDRLPDDIDIEPADLSQVPTIDASPLERLIGASYRPLEDCVADTVQALLKVKA